MTTILCIDDEVQLREVIAEKLEDSGYDVMQARDGIEGLEMINRYEPDLVLCDISILRKNGYELLREIREKSPRFAEMPFIFLTSCADREQVLAGLKDGADAYLTKPIDFEMLMATVQAILRQVERIKEKNDKVYELYMQGA